MALNRLASNALASLIRLLKVAVAIKNFWDISKEFHNSLPFLCISMLLVRVTFYYVYHIVCKLPYKLWRNNMMQAFKSHPVIIFISLYAMPLYANIMWPATFTSKAITSSLSIILLSIIIEGIVLYNDLKTISYTKAMIMSVVGNAVSAFLGSVLMMLAMVIWQLSFDALFGGKFLDMFNNATSFIVMYLGSSLIELTVLHRVFKYPTEVLKRPVFLGNFITYALAYIYH
jgi:hypothetical protein